MMMPGGAGEDTLTTTGGQVDNIVFALIDAALDRNDNVTQAIQSSLCDIGKQQPNLVLTCCHSYIGRHPKLALVHKILILSVIEKICSEALNSVKTNVAVNLIKLAVEEMTSSKEIVPEWQNSSSGILVSLGRNFINEVMEQLLMKFTPGILPHFFVIQTMANLASVNAFGMVPFLKSVLGTMLPLLGMVKSENVKWIFAFALAGFCEAILEYIANAGKSPDPTVKKEVFSNEISSAYDVLFNNWLPSREAKVRSQVVVALGQMSHLLPPEKLEEHLPRLVPAILAIYKRYQDYQHTTQGFCMLLDAAVINHSTVLESLLDRIMDALFPQVCTLPDYSQPSLVRNHNEVLRCIAVLASLYSNRLVAFLLQKLENGTEANKIGSLTVFKHLINSSEAHIDGKIPFIISGMKLVLDSGNKVKKMIAQVIVTLAHHDYLKEDGGMDLVWFIVHQCALPDDAPGQRPLDPSYVSNEALRSMCENVMHLLTTTVEKMENILWPTILDSLVQENMTPAVSSLCKSLTVLALKKREELGTDFFIEYGNLNNVTSPQILLARLVVLIGHPSADHEKELQILKFMKVVTPAINKSLMALWDTKIPSLIESLEASDSLEWSQKVWEDQVMTFVSQTLDELDREEWTLKLGKALQGHFILYVNHPDYKCVLLKILGLVLKKVTNKNFVNEALDTIFQNINHSNPSEQKGCAMCVGYCASTHLDIVIVKLEKVAKYDKKNAGIFGFIKEFTGDSDHEKLKATIILCYGYVTANGPMPILLTRIETPILRSVANIYQSSKDFIMKQSMLKTIRLIADAVHPDHLQEPFEFRSRSELLNLVKSILKHEQVMMPLMNDLCTLALKAAASLVALDPALNEAEKRDLILVSVPNVYKLPRDCLLQDETPTKEFNLRLIELVDALNFFLQKLLLKEKNFTNLFSILQNLHLHIMVSDDSVQRERCLHSTLHLLRCYAESTSGDAYTPFNTLGSILGMLVPRCTDPHITVRHLAFDSIDTAVALALRITASSVSFNERQEISLNHLKSQIISDDPSSMFVVTKSLGEFIAEKLPTEQLYPFLRSLVEGLCDRHSYSSSGASVVLNTVIKIKCREIKVEVPNFIEAVRSKLDRIKCPHTRKGALKIFQNLSSHHLPAVLVALLNSPVPLNENTVDIWQTLCEEKVISNHVIEYFLEIFTDNVVASPPDPHGRIVAIHKPLAAVCALREIFKVAEMENCGKEHFDKIFSSLVLVTGAYLGATLPADKVKGSPSFSPARTAIETLKFFLLCVKQEIMVASLTDCGYWVLMEEPDKFPEAVAALGRSICLSLPEQVPKLITFLNPLLSSSVDIHRIVVVSFFVEFLSQSYKGRKNLTEPLINSLLGRLIDSSAVVRRYCISGLGNIAMLDKEQVDRYSTTILSAMMSGMDDRDDPGCFITLEAMSGLSSVLAQVAEADVRNILINIALRIKPMFDKEKPLVRAAAFTLFGNLSRFGNGPSKEQFVEQVHSNFVAFMLHLNDEDRNVIKACKYGLRLLGPILECEELDSMFQKYLLEDSHLSYGEFINEVTKVVITSFPDKIGFHATTSMSYLKSQSPVIQCNAAAFLGHLLGNLPAEKQASIPKERLCSALLVLLKDQSPDVRIRAAEALSLLHHY